MAWGVVLDQSPRLGLEDLLSIRKQRITYNIHHTLTIQCTSGTFSINDQRPRLGGRKTSPRLECVGIQDNSLGHFSVVWSIAKGEATGHSPLLLISEDR